MARASRALSSFWLIAVVAVIVAAAAWVAPAPAFAQSADRNWIEPLITEDSFPSNEVDVTPGWVRDADGRTFFTAVEIEKRINPDTSVEVTGQWDQQSPEGRSRDRTGFDDLEVLLKHALYVRPEHEFRLAAGIDSFWPVGNRQVEDETHFVAGPMLMWAKGMGDLARDSWLRYLRPVEVQGDGGYFFKFSGSLSAQTIADAILAYNIPYMVEDAGGRGPGWPISNLVPFTELNYSQFTNGLRGRTPPGFFITPGLSYFTGPYQLTLGSQVALNHAASHSAQASVLGLLDINLSRLFPAIRGMQF